MRIKEYGLRLTAIACIVIGIDTGLVSAQRSDQDSPKYVDLTAAQAAQLEQKVNGLIREQGVIESASVTEIRAGIGGTILELAPEGTKLKEGDRIGQIDSSAVEDALLVQRTALAKSQAELDQTKRVVAQRRVELEFAHDLSAQQIKVAELRLQALSGKDGESEVQVMNLDDRISAAERVLEAKRIVLDEIKPAGRAELAEGRAMVAVAEAELASLIRQRKLHQVMAELQRAELWLALTQAKTSQANETRIVQVDLAEAEASVKVAHNAEEVEKQKLLTLEKKVAGSVLIAPHDGLLYYPVSRRGQEPMEPGMTVRERQTVARIADMSQLHVAVLVNETRIGRVKVGQKATIRIDAYPGREFQGTVRQINRTAEPSTFLDNAGKKYRVNVSLNKPLPEVRLGMTAQVDIDTTEN